jgi:hypothetical protein
MKGQGHVYDPATASQAPFNQILALQPAFFAAILAEINLQRVRNIVQQEVKSTHAFHTTLSNHLSVADKTMQRHQVCKCWGCGSLDHVCSDQSGTIFCPSANKPEVKTKFDATQKDTHDPCRKACTKKTMEDKRKSGNLLSTFLPLFNKTSMWNSSKHLFPTRRQKPLTSLRNRYLLSLSQPFCAYP